jgi:hypothetical protein
MRKTDKRTEENIKKLKKFIVKLNNNKKIKKDERRY